MVSAILIATSSSEDASVLKPERAAKRGLTSRSSSNVVSCVTGITRSVARSAESSLSAIPSTSRLLNIEGVTSTIPILDVLRPLSISRISDFPRTTSFSLNQTDTFCFSSSSCSSFAAPRLSSQAWHRKTSRRSGYFSEIRTACLCTGERVRTSEGVKETLVPLEVRRLLLRPPPEDEEGAEDRDCVAWYVGAAYERR
ncbi:hypothetical protein EDF61_101472 [Arthrobacter sp. JUb115]|nr:hypothetical protein EDF61_101472 [Arthrobacter sp. JUb115]